MKPKCVVCNKQLKLFEVNLCSCGLDVCVRHAERSLHGCPNGRQRVEELVKVVAPKVIKI